MAEYGLRGSDLDCSLNFSDLNAKLWAIRISDSECFVECFVCTSLTTVVSYCEFADLCSNHFNGSSRPLHHAGLPDDSLKCRALKF